jgi:hypothetical protein
VKAATGVRIEALNKAIEEVLEVEPSMKKAAGSGGPTVNVWEASQSPNFNSTTIRRREAIQRRNTNLYRRRLATILRLSGPEHLGPVDHGKRTRKLPH